MSVLPSYTSLLAKHARSSRPSLAVMACYRRRVVFGSKLGQAELVEGCARVFHLPLRIGDGCSVSPFSTFRNKGSLEAQQLNDHRLGFRGVL